MPTLLKIFGFLYNVIEYTIPPVSNQDRKMMSVPYFLA
jgi:hypothetical protein